MLFLINNALLINTCLAEAWALLLAGELEQTKLTTYITRKLAALQENKTNDNQLQNSHHLIQAGKKIGNISSTAKHIIVKLSATAINTEQEQKLKVFLAELLDGKLEKV